MQRAFLFATATVVGSSLVGAYWIGAAQAENASPDTGASNSSSAVDERVTSGLLAFYDFRDEGGDAVKDRSGVGRPIDLRITKPDAIRRSDGALEIVANTRIRSDQPAAKIIRAVRLSGEVTIEAWIRPSKSDQSGPARIVTLSRSGTERNVTLGQDGDRFDVRLWTTATSPNGLPSVSTKNKTATTDLTHVVYTRDRTGRTRIYLNGKLNVEKTVDGSTSPWHGSFRLALANEFGTDRAWLGTYHLVAIYSRDLLAHEVERHFQTGPDARATQVQVARSSPDPKAEHFENHVAPLLARHCLECHDTSTKKGRLDLSRKDAAMAGGRNGDAIVPGNTADSLVWEYVEFDEMPKDRSPLTDEEKTHLRDWIEAGATWSVETIDPLAYAHDGRARSNWLRRLTVPEYIETVRSAVGIDIAEEARSLLPPDLRADGFSNTAYNLNIDLAHVQAYAQLAEQIVARMDVLAFASRFSKHQRLSTDDNMRELVAGMGKWLLRGPLENHEITSYAGIATTVASAGGDFEEAVRFTIEAMLQSPRFIYRVENQRGDGTVWPVGDYELASRLSYILWGGPPDAELLKAADEGKLYDRGDIDAQVRRMLKDPRAVERSARFIAEWLDLDRLDNMRPHHERFPKWNDRLAQDMRQETLAFFKHVVWEQNRPLSDLLNAQVTFATPRLAAHYGLEPKGEGDGLSRYDLSSVPGRGGLLTQGSVLTVGGDEASMVTRGLFVLQSVLRGSVKDPPPCVDTTPVPTKEGLTQRSIAEARIANPTCGGCHSKFEPLAFGLEKFDGVGAYHEKDEHGNALRDDGEILIPGQDRSIAYDSSAELMNLLAGSERVRESITRKLAQFALGRPLVAPDMPILDKIDQEAEKGGGTYASLITAIVMSDLVQTTRTETE